MSVSYLHFLHLIPRLHRIPHMHWVPHLHLVHFLRVRYCLILHYHFIPCLYSNSFTHSIPHLYSIPLIVSCLYFILNLYLISHLHSFIIYTPSPRSNLCIYTLTVISNHSLVCSLSPKFSLFLSSSVIRKRGIKMLLYCGSALTKGTDHSV